MARWWLVATVGCLMVAGQASAQQPWRLRWVKGQVLNYRVEQQTQISEQTAEAKIETKARLNLLKRWEVQEVTQNGTATLRLVLAAMRQEQTRPNGDVLVFDSADPAKSTPALRDAMSKYIGKTLAHLKIDGQGKVTELMQGSPVQYESDPPFVLRLPPQEPQTGQSWKRTYQITLEPPYGKGEKHAGAQLYEVVKVEDGLATLHLSTELQLPQNPAEQPPLLQKQTAGEIVFDIPNGRVLRVNLQIDKTVEGHQGPGSSYRYVSVYREQLEQ